MDPEATALAVPPALEVPPETEPPAPVPDRVVESEPTPEPVITPEPEDVSAGAPGTDPESAAAGVIAPAPEPEPTAPATALEAAPVSAPPVPEPEEATVPTEPAVARSDEAAATRTAKRPQKGRPKGRLLSRAFDLTGDQRSALTSITEDDAPVDSASSPPPGTAADSDADTAESDAGDPAPD